MLSVIAIPLLLLTQEMWQCRKLIHGHSTNVTNTIEYAVVRDLLSKKDYHVKAKVYIICAGAVLTPQILFNSNITPKALGHYLCEQPLAFCQVVLLQELIDSIPKDPRWKDIVAKYQKDNPKDPIPIPYSDPQPQVE